MANNDYSSINILLLTACYLSALFLVHKIVDHKNMYQLALIFFGRIWSRSSEKQNNLNCPFFPDGLIAFFSGSETVNVITCFDIGIKFFPCRIT